MGEEKSKVLGIRLDVEERKKFDSYVEQEGKGNKEFMQMLLNLYELNRGKTKNINLLGDIEQLEQYTNKIHRSFINIIDKLEEQKATVREEKDGELEIYKEKIKSLELERDTLKAENQRCKEQLKSLISENEMLKEQNKGVQQSLADKVTILEEYKKKNEDLILINKEGKKGIEELKGYKELVQQEQGKNLKLMRIIEEREASICGLREEKEAVEEKFKKMILEEKERAEIRKEKVLWEKEKMHAEEIRKLQEQIKDIHENYYREIGIYQEKYRKLLEQLEAGKVESKK